MAVVSCAFFQRNLQANPYDLAMSKIDHKDLKEIGSVVKISSEEVVQEIHELVLILLEQPIISEKNGRSVRSLSINQGEIVLFSTSGKNGATVGNHASGGELSSLVVIIEAKKSVLLRQCASAHDPTIMTSELHPNEVSIIYPNQIHALRLPPESQVLIIKNKAWVEAKADSFRELIPYNFDDGDLSSK